ncbi:MULTISPECIES: hypothetical protein [Methylomicrobium]|uniref:Uncharacterized protein n=1 Tax=Methylomicrobium album BG8 TaxID=686340 RepID=H8GHX1_METAL|nr:MULTISPECIES: hypothetical protein [Methylomicrobium]EIC28955.1 hypothetical protein Metal_1140 [Methylomicrobium album BG8]
MEDFNILTDKDKQDMSYKACVGGAILMGAAVGRLGMLPGLLAGAATGLAFGLLTCKRLSPAIERKLFSQNERLNDQELLQTLRILRDETGVTSKSDAMRLLGYVRFEANQKGQSLKNGRNACMPMKVAANQILSVRV